MRVAACSTLSLFMLTSCANYQGTFYAPKDMGNTETISKNYVHDLQVCIVPEATDNILKIDSGLNEVLIDCDVSRYIQNKIKDDFKNCTIVSDEKAHSTCDVNLYLKQSIISESNKMSYHLYMKAKDVKTDKIFYSEKTTSGRYYDKSSGAFMFFSALLLPPVLGGLFYAIRVNSIADTNFETAKSMISYAVDENVARFDKASFPKR